MNMIFGAMGPCVWRRALRTAQQTAGAGLHTLGMPGGMMGARAAAPGPGCPRRCVWHGLDCAIVFDGRLTNRAELRSLAERRGFPLADGDDGELALALYMLFGQECVQMLHGSFALAVFDYQQNILFLARDRLGLAPLWLVRRGPMLAFASRVQPLLALPEIEPVITRQGLGQLILSPAPVGTVFRDVQAFPAGHTAIFRGGSLTLRRSWFLRSRPLLGGEAAETRAETLRRNALDAYGEGGAMLQCPSAPKMPDPSLFAAAVAAADLPGRSRPRCWRFCSKQPGARPLHWPMWARQGFLPFCPSPVIFLCFVKTLCRLPGCRAAPCRPALMRMPHTHAFCGGRPCVRFFCPALPAGMPWAGPPGWPYIFPIWITGWWNTNTTCAPPWRAAPLPSLPPSRCRKARWKALPARRLFWRRFCSRRPLLRRWKAGSQHRFCTGWRL